MKIAVIDPWNFTPPYDLELCGGLASLGHEVKLVGQEAKGADEVIDGSSRGFASSGLFKAPASWLPRALLLPMKGMFHIVGMLRLLHELRRMGPDVIHVQWLALPLIDILFLPFLRRIAPVVLTVHDSNPFNGAGPLLLRLGHMMAVRRCDRWIVHNDMSAQHLVEQGLDPDRIHRVAHGLLNPVDENDISENSRERHDGKLHVLQFGKLKEYKGADVLLEAVASLSDEQRSHCHVAVVGRPYLETQPLLDLLARHQLQDVVSLRFDFVSDGEMAALFDRADVLVFPYRAIDTSGVLMAAISRAIPVVASNIGCFAEMLSDGEEGRLVPPGDPVSLSNVLADLIDDPAKVDAMRGRMASLRDRIPSWRRIAETTTEVYDLAQTPPTSKPIGAHT